MNNMDVFKKHTHLNLDIDSHLETLGEFIRYHRELKQFSLEELSMKTKIRIQQLSNLEQNNFPELPNAVYLKGFIKSICHELDLNVEIALNYLNDNTIAEDTIEFLTPGKEIKPLNFNFKFFDKSKIKIDQKMLFGSLVLVVIVGSFIGNTRPKNHKAPEAIVHKRMNIFEAKKLVQQDGVTDLTPPDSIIIAAPIINADGSLVVAKKLSLNNDIVEGRKMVTETAAVEVQKVAAPVAAPAVIAPPVTPVVAPQAVIPQPAATATESATASTTTKLTVTAKKGTAFLVYRVNGEKKNKIYLRHGKTLELEGSEIRMDVGNPGAVEFTKNGEVLDVKPEPGRASVHLNF
jgi:cytoskeletal protein RodZ